MYVLGGFFIQTIILCIFQGRFLIFSDGEAANSDVWFMVGFFGMALLFQSCVLFHHKRKQQKCVLPSVPSQILAEQNAPARIAIRGEIVYGGLSGIANATSNYFLLPAKKAEGLSRTSLGKIMINIAPLKGIVLHTSFA